MQNKTTEEIKNFIKKTESFRDKPYLCPAKRLTIGFGHRIKKGETFTSLTVEEANLLFLKDLQVFEDWLNANKRVDLNDNQFSALISLTYNIGTEAMHDSKIMQYIHQENFRMASLQFPKYNKSHIAGVLTELKGLTTRRLYEQSVFNRP